MHLVIFIPLVALLSTIIVAGLPWHIRDLALSHQLRLFKLLLGVILYNVCEFNLILFQPLLLHFIEQRQARIVIAIPIDDVEADAGVERSLFYLFG